MKNSVLQHAQRLTTENSVQGQKAAFNHRKQRQTTENYREQCLTTGSSV
jgi:hypothetical protein